MKKKIPSLVMLVVLIVGIILMGYGISGRGIYDNAAAMMGVSKKDAMSFVQDPATLTAVGDMNALGVDKVKSFLKGLGLDAGQVDAAVDARAAYETAAADSKDAEKFKAYAMSVDETVTDDTFKDLVMDHERSDAMRKEMALNALGVDEAAYAELESNTAVLDLYRQGIPALLENSHMVNAVPVMFVGLILVAAAFAFFLIKAMSLKPRPRTHAANPKVEKITSFLLNYALFIILGLILIIVSIIKPNFLAMNNILNILQNASTKGILALGCAGLIVLAGTDLSIGRVLGLSAAVTASLVQSTTYVSRMFPTIVAPMNGVALILIPLFSSIAVAVLFSLINGFGVAKLHLHAFIVTLGTQLIAYGANCLYIESQPSGTAQALSTFDPRFTNFAAGAFNLGAVRIPFVVIYFLVLALIVWVIWNKTTLGKNMFAVGGNTEAAAVSGVNVAKTIMLVYLMAGVLYGISSFLEAARITSVGANTGLNYETDAISAVVVGGVSFSGGVGTIQGVVIGAIILQAIVYALQFLGVNPYIQYIIRGLIIVLAVSIDVRKYIVKK